MALTEWKQYFSQIPDWFRAGHTFPDCSGLVPVQLAQSRNMMFLYTSISNSGLLFRAGTRLDIQFSMLITNFRTGSSLVSAQVCLMVLIAKKMILPFFYRFYLYRFFTVFVSPARPLGEEGVGGCIGIGTIGGDILPRGRQNVADFTRRNAAYLPIYRYRFFIVFFLPGP